MSIRVEQSYRPVIGDASRGHAATLLGLRRALSRVYLPAFAILALAATLVGMGWADQWSGQSLFGAMTSLRIVIIGPATLVALGILLVAERLWPAQDRPIFARGYRQDLLYAVLNATLVIPLVAAMTLSFSLVIRTRLPWITFPRLSSVPHTVVILAIFVAMDACNWAAHLANHKVRSLWRFHELHHSQEDMSVLTVFRTHPLVHVVYLVALLPGLVLLANGALPTTLLIGYAAMVALAHSNIRLGFGPLDRIFVSPNFHRQHHRLEGAQDVNLGFALSIWDQMAHRAVFPTKETVGIATGLPGRPLVVEQAGERPRHLSVFVAQLLAPFRPLSDQESALRTSVDDPSAPR